MAMSAPTSTERAARLARMTGVYLLTPDVGDDHMLTTLEQALDAGVSVVQYRNKRAAPGERRRQLSGVQRLTLAHRALLIVNDDIDLALEFDVDGVHLGRDDGDLAQARRRLPRALLGASCYADIQRAERAVACGADVLAFGSVFPSMTKPDAVRASLALITEARTRFVQQRVVAIGGIDSANIAAVSGAGAHAAALISAVFDAPDPAHASATLQFEFERGRRIHGTQRTTV
ncbi:MAG TPA: thiamine phosphate synthase [Burkholderiaceae bacterium]|nr:thiamine phosphate synthase [Burkholderiaceae bacterium]